MRAHRLTHASTHSSSSSSNWILMSCQPHRITSGQSNSGHKQIHISTLLTYISTLCQVSLQNQSLRKHKTYIHKHQTQIFEEFVSSITPVKRTHKARTCWYCQPFRLIYRSQVKEIYKKGMEIQYILFYFI